MRSTTKPLPILSALGALCLAAPVVLAGPRVQSGLDRLAAGMPHPFADKRVGLIVHAASVTADKSHAIEVLRRRGAKVVRLFAPEHGLRSGAAAGERIESGLDPISGLPVVSLYGDHIRPRLGDLEDLDVLVFDLQDAGVRFYTYVSTLIYSLDAAAEAGLEIVVLDRPNPLGGERVEGPISAPRDVVPESFVNLAPGPLVHGLTLGEMARYVNALRDRPAHLTVLPMRGWTRNMTWFDTGLVWVPPSPNLRSAEAALAYPGVALLEATNISEGRGTLSPFLLLGAPWLDPSRVVVSLPGFELAPTRFVPRSSAAAPSPKHLGKECRGLRVRVTDPQLASAYELGLTLLHILAQQPGFEWRQGGDGLTRLIGTPRIVRELRAHKSVQDILDADREDHGAWRAARRPALLY